MPDLGPILAWIQLKILTWYYNFGLSKEERAENKAALAEWEKHRG